MLPPEELMTQRFMPAMRLLVAKELLRQGHSQPRVSAMLGVTQASVSNYGSSDARRAYGWLEGLSMGKEEADRCVTLVCEDLKRNPVYAVETVESFWRGLLGKGRVCGAHRALYPSLAECDVCVREFGGSRLSLSEAVTDVSEAVRYLEYSPVFASVMPQVSVNLAYLPRGSESEQDVVAVPGRIVRVGQSAKAMSLPAAGSSRHLARILLLVRKRRKRTRAVINLRYDTKMRRVLRGLRLRVIEIGGYPVSEGTDGTAEALAKQLSKEGDEFDAVVDSGSAGIEPNVYLFGEDAHDTSRLAVRVAEAYSAR